MDLRSKLLEESQKSIRVEMTRKTQAELMAKELSIEKESLERKHQQAMDQIAELSVMKDKFSEKLHEETTRYKIELNREYAGMLSSVEIEKSKLANDRAILEERQKISEQLFAQSDSLRDENKKLKAGLEACEAERDSFKEKARDLELKVNIQHNSSALEFELSSLKRFC